MKFYLLRKIIDFFKKNKKKDLIDQFNANDPSKGSQYTFEPSPQINETEPGLFRGTSSMMDNPSELLVFILLIFVGLGIFVLSYSDNPIKTFIISLVHPTAASQP